MLYMSLPHLPLCMNIIGNVPAQLTHSNPSASDVQQVNDSKCTIIASRVISINNSDQVPLSFHISAKLCDYSLQQRSNF